MPKYWQSAGFKALEAEWNEKLRADGFVDAERGSERSADGRVLLEGSTRCYRNLLKGPRRDWPDIFAWALQRAIKRSAVCDYYELISKHMDYSPPRRRLDKIIMYYVALGSEIKEISEELKPLGLPSHRQTIRFIIRTYEHKWGIRKWDKKSLNPSWRTTRIR